MLSTPRRLLEPSLPRPVAIALIAIAPAVSFVQPLSAQLPSADRVDPRVIAGIAVLILRNLPTSRRHVPAPDIPSSGSAAAEARVVPTAERYIGVPYRWGGTSPRTGFDCSGFVQYVFAKHDVRLPRTSRAMSHVGQRLPIDVDRMRAGDLIMFAEDGEPISHVAIYAGRGRIIHSSSSGNGVRLDDLDTHRGQWFLHHMAAARRVTPYGSGLVLDLVKDLAPALLQLPLDRGDSAPRP